MKAAREFCERLSALARTTAGPDATREGSARHPFAVERAREALRAAMSESAEIAKSRNIGPTVVGAEVMAGALIEYAEWYAAQRSADIVWRARGEVAQILLVARKALDDVQGAIAREEGRAPTER